MVIRIINRIVKSYRQAWHHGISKYCWVANQGNANVMTTTTNVATANATTANVMTTVP